MGLDVGRDAGEPVSAWGVPVRGGVAGHPPQRRGEESTQYFIVAGGATAGTGSYTLTVTVTGVEHIAAAQTADDHRADTGTGGAVEVGGSATGEIETAGDQDWFGVTLSADTVYLIDLEGADTNQGTLHNPRLLGVYDSEGKPLAGTGDDNSGEGRNSRVALQSHGSARPTTSRWARSRRRTRRRLGRTGCRCGVWRWLRT